MSLEPWERELYSQCRAAHEAEIARLMPMVDKEFQRAYNAPLSKELREQGLGATLVSELLAKVKRENDNV